MSTDHLSRLETGDAGQESRAAGLVVVQVGDGAQNPMHADGWPLARRETVVKLDAIEDRREVLIWISFSREQSDPA